MSTFRYSLIFLRSLGGQILDIAGRALGAGLLVAEERKPHLVLHRRVGAELGGDLQQARHTGAVVDDARAVRDRVQVGADQHDSAGVSGAGLRDDVASDRGHPSRRRTPRRSGCSLRSRRRAIRRPRSRRSPRSPGPGGPVAGCTARRWTRRSATFRDPGRLFAGDHSAGDGRPRTHRPTPRPRPTRLPRTPRPAAHTGVGVPTPVCVGARRSRKTVSDVAVVLVDAFADAEGAVAGRVVQGDPGLDLGRSRIAGSTAVRYSR